MVVVKPSLWKNGRAVYSFLMYEEGGQAYRLALAKKTACADRTITWFRVWEEAVWLQHSFQLSCGCVFHFSTRICAHNIGQWHLGLPLFAWKCPSSWNRLWAGRKTGMCDWEDSERIQTCFWGPEKSLKQGVETLKRFWPGEMKCKWKSRGPQGPGDFRPSL